MHNERFLNIFRLSSLMVAAAHFHLMIDTATTVVGGLVPPEEQNSEVSTKFVCISCNESENVVHLFNLRFTSVHVSKLPPSASWQDLKVSSHF